MIDELLILFCRTPELGKVKKRLAAEIGEEEALRHYITLLAKTLQTINQSGINCEIHYRGEDLSFFQENARGKPLVDQKGSDLGERMSNALIGGLEKAKSAILIGSDILDLESSDLRGAAESLPENDLVLGPSKDGGYYLIGATKPYPELFKNVEWGSDRVFAQTLEKARTLGLKVFVAKPRTDLDRLEDLRNLKDGSGD